MKEKVEIRSVGSTRAGNDGPPLGGRLLTPEECAAFLQIEVNTIYVMRSQGRIPYRKVGHLLRFDLGEIIEWTKPKAK